MKVRFKHYIEEHKLFDHNDRILLGVSGGIDSMVMIHLFDSCGFNYAVAHCNFGLRGRESDGDEQLVKDVVAKLGKQIYVNQFKTTEYAKINKKSIQVAARELRYQWFDEICKQHDFKALAIAHNSNDVAETMLINLTRGTGIKGLTGIKPKINRIIRPLLFASREEIEVYAAKNGIVYRTDSSNADVKYARNRIRKIVIPEFEKINPDIVSNLNTSSQFMAQAWEMICEGHSTLKNIIHTQVGNENKYSIQQLVNHNHRLLFLAIEFMEYGFASEVIPEIEKSLFTQPGKVFHAPNFLLVRDRDYLILSPKINSQTGIVFVDEKTESIHSPIGLSIEIIELSNKFLIPKSPTIGALDYEKLTFPLTLRPWKWGDWFTPLGMKGKKKISDFLVDQKVPIHKKDSIYVLESNGSITWVIGFRIDDRFKVINTTKKVWMVKQVMD